MYTSVLHSRVYDRLAPALFRASRVRAVGIVLRRGMRPPIAECEGGLPFGVTVFDDGYAGVANLDPALRAALAAATGAAARDGVILRVNSGWRSREYQAQLLRDAVEKYGSVARAARWVATPSTSVHVAGEAVDIGPVAGAAWLAEHGAAYGLCRIYRNEPWHFELRPEAVTHGPPPTLADPSHDPRLT